MSKAGSRFLMSVTICSGIFANAVVCRATTTLASVGGDWDSGVVAAGGSPPFQNHADTLGTGTWQYGEYDPYTDSSVQALNRDTTNGQYDSARSGVIIKREFMAPSLFSSTPDVALQIWNAGTGESGNLTIAGTVSVPVNAAGSVMFELVQNQNIGTPIDSFTVAPGGSHNYSDIVAVVVGDFINFAIAPTGNTLNDGAFVSGTISVPEPVSLGAATTFLCLFRRRRRMSAR